MDETKDGIIRSTIFFNIHVQNFNRIFNNFKISISPILKTFFFSVVIFPYFYPYYIIFNIIYFFCLILFSYYSHIIYSFPIMHIFSYYYKNMEFEVFFKKYILEQ